MEQQKVYYFDNNATTRIAPEVVDAMIPFLREFWGNPSSAYGFGAQVHGHVEKAREQVAALVNADPKEIVFTSCGTESNNSAIHSALVTSGKRHVITTKVEHSANISFGAHLEKMGFEVTYLPVESDGSLDLHVLEQSIRPDTAIVSIMYANNETGVVFPIEEVAAICRSKGVLCHTDAVQVPGKLPIDVKRLGVDFLSLSAHKLHAPKGVGMLYVKKRTRYTPYVIGGHQERGRREPRCRPSSRQQARSRGARVGRLSGRQAQRGPRTPRCAVVLRGVRRHSGVRRRAVGASRRRERVAHAGRA